MSAAGVWSLVLCSVDTSDQRVQAGLGWLRDNYAPIDTVGNPCYGDTYLYYYLLGFAKTLIMTGTPPGSWQETASQDLTNYTVNQQHDDGHWSSGEGDLFATEQAILALQTRIIPADVQRLSWLTFILHSPVDLHIYDPLGRHVGMNYTTGEIEVQIPNATYNTSNGDLNITVPHLEAGDYRLILIGTGTGNYTLDIIGRVRDTVVAEDSYTGNITEGEVHGATVTVAMITGLSIHVTDAPAPLLETTLTQVSLASSDPTITKVYVSGLNLSDVNETYKPASITSRSAYMVNSTGAGNFTLRFTGVPNANTITAYKINATNHWIALDTTVTADTVTFRMEAGDPPVVFGSSDGIPLNAGWNLISVPLVMADTSVENVVSSISGNYTRVMAYEQGYKTYDPALPGFSTLHNITYRMGFWVNMNTSDNLTVTGTTPTDKTIQLTDGWNLVSYMGATSMNVTDALSSISGNYTRVMAFEQGYETYDPALPGFSTLDVMKPNMGYWIKMDGSAELVYA